LFRVVDVVPKNATVWKLKVWPTLAEVNVPEGVDTVMVIEAPAATATTED